MSDYRIAKDDAWFALFMVFFTGVFVGVFIGGIATYYDLRNAGALTQEYLWRHYR